MTKILSVLSLVLILPMLFVGCTMSKPSAEQIKADLVSERITVSYGLFGRWTFAALSEFQQFDIRGQETQGNVTEYDVSMRLQDVSNNTHFLADALITYTETNGKWKLTSVTLKLFKQI